jgi:N-acyl homoserine lactone hydrolase
VKILRLHLARLRAAEGSGESEWPVHGFVIMHEKAGPILVDTGVGGPEEWLSDWRVVNRSVADALGEHDLSPADVRVVVNTHLHFDHCGQNSVFKHAPFYVQRSELERARREAKPLVDWFDFAGARFELLDGDAQIAEGVRAVATPGHTVGHQSVLVTTASGDEVLIGDAAYTPDIYTDPEREQLPRNQAADRTAWNGSLRRLHGMTPSRVHFCHDAAVVER